MNDIEVAAEWLSWVRDGGGLREVIARVYDLRHLPASEIAPKLHIPPQAAQALLDFVADYVRRCPPMPSITPTPCVPWVLQPGDPPHVGPWLPAPFTAEPVEAEGDRDLRRRIREDDRQRLSEEMLAAPLDDSPLPD